MINLKIFLKKILELQINFILEKNLNKYNVKEDYDILYIGANALASEVYDKYYIKMKYI